MFKMVLLYKSLAHPELERVDGRHLLSSGKNARIWMAHTTEGDL